MAKNKTPQSRRLLALAALATLTACGDDFMASEKDARTLNVIRLAAEEGEGGKTTAKLAAGAGGTQVLAATGGAIQGATLSLPPGTLGVSVDLTIEEGLPVVSSDTATSLGIPSDKIAAAGPAVVFQPSSPVQTAQPFTLAIPYTDGLSLTQGGELVVLFKATVVEDGKTSLVLGVIPAAELVIKGGVVSFQTTRFGVFQVARAAVKIEAPNTVPTFEPIGAKRDEGNPLVGLWASDCYEERHGDPQSPSEWRKTSIQFTATAFSHVGTRYAAAGCAGAFEEREVTTGTYVIGKDSAVEAGAKEIDVLFKSLAVTLGSARAVRDANERGHCGSKDWKLGEAREVATCSHGDDDGGPRVGVTMYEIVKVDGKALRFGDGSGEGSGSTPAKRSTRLEPAEKALKRQE